MAKLLLKKKPAKASSPVSDLAAPGKVASEAKGLQLSSLKVFDIPMGQLVEHKENPNEQDERVFEELVERIRRDGFDDPIKVVPELIKGKPTGKYLIVGGHHRRKAAELLGYKTIPAIIREGWDQDRVDIELIADNSLGGKINPFKFTELFSRLQKRYDPEQLKKMVGLTEKKAFNALFKQVSSQLPAKAKKKLEEAKETINSIEDLSSVLNTIFREHGSEVDHSIMVMSYGGKKHTYIQIDGPTQKRLEALKERHDAGEFKIGDFFAKLLNDPAADNVINGLKNDA